MAPYQTRFIVLYEGDNDIASGKSPDAVLADFEEFIRRMERALPETRVAFISMKPSPSRLKHLERMREANRLIRDRLSRQPGWLYVEVFTPMLNQQGEPREELFRSDRLHLNEEGYALWANILRPVLADAARAKGRAR